jgi:phosphotransacetylase/butyrate kinase
MSAKVDSSAGGPEQGLQAVSDLVDIAGRLRASSVIIPGGSRLEDLHLTEAARDNGIIDRIILVGKKDQVHSAVEESGMDIASEDIVAVENDEAVAQATVAQIGKGAADIVLKGDISTPILNRALLPLAKRSTVSLVSIFDAAPIAKGRPLILTDAGFTTVCNIGRLTDLIHNAIDVAKVVMDIARPRVAILSANEKQIPSLPSTWMGLELAQRAWQDAVVCGPLSFDLATSRKSVAVKGMPKLPGAQDVAGQADILVCPGIDAANILYKALTAMTRYGQASIAGITVGFPIPYIILSRADALETRLDSIALCSIYAQKRAQLKAKASSGTVVSMPRSQRILTVNPGATAIDLAVYDKDQYILDFAVPAEPNSNQGAAIERISKGIYQQLQENGIEQLDAVSTRAEGLDLSCESALHNPIFLVAQKPGHNIKMAEDKDRCPGHARREPSNDLSMRLTIELAQHYRSTGLLVKPGRAQRWCVRTAARRAALTLGRQVDHVNLVVAHLGHELTIASVRSGKIVDCSCAQPGPGPSTSTWAALLQTGGSADNQGLYTYIKEQGWSALEQTLAEGDTQVQRLLEDMVLRIAQGIGAAYVAADCAAEAIVLSGEWLQSPFLRNALRKRIVRLAPVQVYQGSMEMEGLAGDTLDVLSGRTQALPTPSAEHGKEIGRD